MTKITAESKQKVVSPVARTNGACYLFLQHEDHTVVRDFVVILFLVVFFPLGHSFPVRSDSELVLAIFGSRSRTLTTEETKQKFLREKLLCTLF